MAEKINSFTDEQWAQVHQAREEWLAHGLSNQPADRPRAEVAMRQLYKENGFEEPHTIIWLDSPFAGCMLSAILTDEGLREKIKRCVQHSVDEAIGKWEAAGGVRPTAAKTPSKTKSKKAVKSSKRKPKSKASVAAADKSPLAASSVMDQLLKTLLVLMEDTIKSFLKGEPFEEILPLIELKLDDAVVKELTEKAREQVSKACYGQHDSFWIGHYETCHKLGLTGLEKVLPLAEIAKSAGWWWPFEGVVIMTERLSVLHRDDQHRLHCENGPAVSYPDGWSVWAIHGVRVPRRVVEEPHTLTVEEIKAEQNVEVKRIMIERRGWDYYLRELNAEELDRRQNDIEATREQLFKVDGMCVLRTFCPSTGRVYALEVPQTLTSCAQAQSWLWDVQNADKQIVGRT